MPFNSDPTVPADSEAEGLGAGRIRNIASTINQLFGQAAGALYTFLQSPFGLDAAGLPTVPANPTQPLGIAPKQYVDAAIVGASVPQGALLVGPAAYTTTLSPTPANQAALLNKIIEVQANVDCAAGPVTLNANAFGALAIQKWSNGALVDLQAADIKANSTLLLVYDGTVYELVSVANQIRQLDGSSGAWGLIGNSLGGNGQITLSATQLILHPFNTSGAMVLPGFAAGATLDIINNVQIVNGRDQAVAFGAGATVHVFGIYGAGQPTGLIASASPTTPTLPANYTNYGYLASFILDAGGFFLPLLVDGPDVFYKTQQATSLAGGQSAVEANVSLASRVPVNASKVRLQIEGSITIGGAGGFNQGVLAIRLATGVDHYVMKPWGYAAGAHHTEQDVTLEVPNNIAGQNLIYIWTTVPSTAGGFSYGASAWTLGYSCPNNG